MSSISVLGPVAIDDAGGPLSPRDRVVLSVLVTHRGHEVSPDTLAEALWGDAPPASSTKVVQGCVGRLRRRLGAEAIGTGRGGYTLTVPAEEVDAGRFERLVQRARDFLALNHPDQAAYAADEALSLWRGRPLTDLEEWEPGRGESQRLTELRLNAEEVRLAALLTAGRHAEVLPEATLRVQEQPLRERRWALLARAQYQDGRQAEALATLRRAREVLAEELGLDPGEELVDLERAVLQQDPTLSVGAAARTSAVCPWPGLASYDVEDADAFFGREAELGECLRRMANTPLIAVVGPSGSGKSSLVRAGLAARLRDQGRVVRVMTPGARPLDTLTMELAQLGPGGVLVVDQCEEIVAPQVPEGVRTDFLDRVVGHTAVGPVVLTLRADRLGELTAYPHAARLVEEGLYLLGGMDEVALRQTIEGPAHRAGLLLEPGLVDLLVRDVDGEPGSLPMLAHALRQTWERREGNTLTVEGFRASGGIRGAIARSAEEVYESATEDQRHALRELLLRMVRPGPGGFPVRTSVSREVVADAEHVEVVERLVRARLVTVEADRLEIAHEALVRAWPRLQSWLADDVQGELIRHHLAAAADAWDAMGRPGSELYRGARLAATREWRAAGIHRLSRVETDFLAESEAAHQSRLARAEHEARRQRTVNRRLRLLVVGVTVLAMVAATFWVLADRQTSVARGQRLSAAALAAVDQDPALAKALAVLGAEAAPPSLQMTGALHRAFAADRVVSRVSMNHDTDRLWAVLHPDGDEVAMTAEHVYQPATAVEVHDAHSGALIWEWARPERPEYGSVVVAGAQYSPDGSLLMVGVLSDPGSTFRLGPPLGEAPRPPRGALGVQVWDTRTHHLLQVVDVGPCGGWPVAVGGDRLLVRTLVAPPSKELSADEEESLLDECRWLDGGMATLLVDRRTGTSHTVSVTEALNLHLTIGHALTDDGSLAVVPDFDTWSAVLVDGSSGRELGRFPEAVAHDFDPSGKHLLTVDVKGRRTDLWSVVSVPDLETEVVYTGRSSWSSYGRFADDGETVYTTGIENALVQWDARTGRHLRSLPAVGGGAPTSSGEHVLVPRPETTGAVLLDTSPPGELWSVLSCGGIAGKDRLQVTERLVVVGRDCEEPQEGRLETFTLEGTRSGSWAGVSWESLAVSPDGRQVVARTGAGTDEDGLPQVGPLTVRDLRTGTTVRPLEGFCTHTLPDFLTGLDLDSTTRARCGSFPERPFSFATWTVDWSPDGRWIAAIDRGVTVWDARTGDLVTTLPDAALGGPPTFLPYDLQFSPDSRRLLVTTQARTVVGVDTTTWVPVRDQRLELQQAYSAGLAGVAADGSVVVVSPLFQIAASTAVLLVDPDSLAVRQVWTGVADGAVQTADVSPDGSRLALGTSEGLLTVWDVSSGALIDQADPRLGALDGVRWIDDTYLVLLSTDGHLTTVTTDARELLDLTRGSLTRGLAQTECATYGVEACPSLAQLRGSAPVVPDELRGAYTLTWAPEELRAALVAHAEESFGDLDETSVARLAEQADLLAGTYRVEIGEADYTITKGDLGEVWCSGSVSGSADLLLLGADTGSRCTDFHYAETGWSLDADTLRLPAETFRGKYVDTVLWTSKPLERTD